MSFRSYKQRRLRASVLRPQEVEKTRIPDEFYKYMESTNTRFSDICRIYLKGLSIDDIKYLTPEDLINIVPEKNYEHKLLMTIMVRRYLYRHTDDPDDECSTMCVPPPKADVVSDVIEPVKQNDSNCCKNNCRDNEQNYTVTTQKKIFTKSQGLLDSLIKGNPDSEASLFSQSSVDSLESTSDKDNSQNKKKCEKCNYDKE